MEKDNHLWEIRKKYPTFYDERYDQSDEIWEVLEGNYREYDNDYITPYDKEKRKKETNIDNFYNWD